MSEIRPRFSARSRMVAARPMGGWDLFFEALRRAERGEDIVLLAVGDHEFPTPAFIVEAAVGSLRRGRHHYTPFAGIRELREAIAAFYRRLGERVDPAEVTVHAGAQGGLYALFQCLLDPGDEVIGFEPMYVTYPETVAAAGARLVPVPLSFGRGFAVDVGEVERRIGPRTRAVLLNTPHNPTGAVVDADTIRRLAGLCARHGLWLVSDEVYAGMVYGEGHASALAVRGICERTVVVESLSKSCAMTGWRVGWTVTPPDLAGLLEQLEGVTTYGLPPFVQDAAVVALAHIDELEAEMRRRYARRAAIALEALAGAPGLEPFAPRAGMFVVARIAGTGLDGRTFARRLLDEAGVAVMPGDAFGPSFADGIRISLAAEEERLREGCRRIAAFARRIAEEGRG